MNDKMIKTNTMNVRLVDLTSLKIYVFVILTFLFLSLFRISCFEFRIFNRKGGFSVRPNAR